MVLYHFSEDPTIKRFDPRPTEATSTPLVWAIDALRQCNYLLPRDCPRVTYYAGPSTRNEDLRRFLGRSSAVVTVEKSWMQRIEETKLCRYRLPIDHFQCADAVAGYYVSESPVTPIGMARIDDLPKAILTAGAELRAVETLWPLYEEVAASTLAFSMIRMRHAAPRL